ncbi:MAG: GGDEF domain-containing protein, partial [Mucispirillum sp.]|nr:GGDEF domain-containing protein [Mucispirillum sp.]
MSKLNTLLKENYDLKNELESMVLRVKENEVKHQGFKTVQYSMLLSDNLNEISDKPMRYIEEIFDIDKTALFIRRGAFAVAEQSQSLGSRVLTAADDAFKYTFLENNM